MASDPNISKREKVGARHRGREFCLALLYAADSGSSPLSDAFQHAETVLDSLSEEWQLEPDEARKLRPAGNRCGRRLCEQFILHHEEVDQRIEALAQGWTLDRMPVVDRTLLRMALAELLYLPDIPLGATIDEAVDLAKAYGTAESSKFINGILGAVARELPDKRPATPTEAD